MKTRSLARGMAAASLLMGIGLALPAQAEEASLVVGLLTCKGDRNIGLIVGSRQQLACTFAPSNGLPEQAYRARLTRVGLDLGIQGPSVMIWRVATHTNTVPSGALAGRYSGATASASALVGAGANALVGGSRNAFALQPLSAQVQTGVNLAAGVASLRLTYVPR